MKLSRSVIALCMVMLVSGCAYTSACHELASKNRFKLWRMASTANSGDFKRHVILLETGNELSSICRSHFIDQEAFDGIPDSLRSWCRKQGSSSDKYCTLYQLDTNVVKQRIQ